MIHLDGRPVATPCVRLIVLKDFLCLVGEYISFQLHSRHGANTILILVSLSEGVVN